MSTPIIKQRVLFASPHEDRFFSWAEASGKQGGTCLLPQQPQNSLARRKKELESNASLIVLTIITDHCADTELALLFATWNPHSMKALYSIWLTFTEQQYFFFSSAAMEFHELLTRQITKFWRINKAVCWVYWRKKQRANVPPLTSSQPALFALKGLSLSCWNVVLTHHCVISIWCHY